MAISISGVRLNIRLEALDSGEGFTVDVSGAMDRGNDDENRQASRKGQELSIFGRRINGHEPTFADAKTAIANEVDTFATEVSNFIDDWNNGVIEGSPNYTG